MFDKVYLKISFRWYDDSGLYHLFFHMMDIGMIYTIEGWKNPPLSETPSLECHTPHNVLVKKSLADRNYRCGVQVRPRHHYIILYTYYYLYCRDSGDGGIRARTLLSIAVWPAGSAGGSLASFFVITAITIEIEM